MENKKGLDIFRVGIGLMLASLVFLDVAVLLYTPAAAIALTLLTVGVIFQVYSLI